MFRVCILPILVCLCFQVIAQDDLDYCSRIKYTFSSESHLIVNGTTNVNSFACTNTNRLPSYEAIVCGNSTTGLIEFLQASLKIPVLQMDCGGKGINSDFRDMMKADKYPNILLELWELNLDRVTSTGTRHYTASTSITLVNTKRAVRIPVQLRKTGHSSYHINGSVALQLSDFGIVPPKPLMGLIKVHDEIEIEFQLDMSLHL